jgi:RNA polymerase sigma-70 factor (ECF subfamily)
MAAMDALARGRLAWPGLEIPADAFAAFVAARDASHPEDLYLACGCARRDPAAVRAFEERVLPEVEPAVRRLAPDRDFASEVRQRVRAQLLVGDAPRIGEYGGRGALVSWVRVVAVRVALMMLRAEKGAGRRAAALADEPATPELDPELDLIKRRHRAPFGKALAAAVGALSPHERNLIQLHIVEGLSLAQIGALHGVNKSTVSRWIASAKEEIEKGVRERLRAEWRVGEAELDSLLGVLRSRIDLTLERILK